MDGTHNELKRRSSSITESKKSKIKYCNIKNNEDVSDDDGEYEGNYDEGDGSNKDVDIRSEDEPSLSDNESSLPSLSPPYGARTHNEFKQRSNSITESKKSNTKYCHTKDNEDISDKDVDIRREDDSSDDEDSLPSLSPPYKDKDGDNYKSKKCDVEEDDVDDDDSEEEDDDDNNDTNGHDDDGHDENYYTDDYNEDGNNEDSVVSKARNFTRETKSNKPITRKAAFDGQTKLYEITFDSIVNAKDLTDLFDGIRKDLNYQIKNAIRKHRKVQATLELEGFFEEYEYKTIHFDATAELNSQKEVQTYLEMAQDEIQNKFIAYDENNPEPKQFSCLYLRLHKLSYTEDKLWVPKEIKDHITDFGDHQNVMSFKWSVLAALHPECIPSIAYLEEYTNELVMDGVNYPVQLKDLPRIEDMNKFSINVYMLMYSYQNKMNEIEGPVYHTIERKKNHINLLHLHINQTFRFCQIKDLRRLVNPDSSRYFCDGCFNDLQKKASYLRHQKDCRRVKTTFPQNIQKFDNKSQTDYVTFVVYADFEALLEIVGTYDSNEAEGVKRQTKNIRKHVPFSYGYYIKCIDDKYSIFKTYEGLDCAKIFCKNLIEDLKQQISKYEMDYEETPVEYVPVFFHNLKGYDGHFIIQGADHESVLGNLNNYFAIYNSFTQDGNKFELRILDSYKFLKEALKKLVDGLSNNKNIFKAVNNNLCKTDKDLQLLTRKGIFPYNYVASLNDLEKTLLPEKEMFYNDLDGTEVSDEEYQHALSVWNYFQCKTIHDYAGLYLKLDVLLLADVFENFRLFCKNNYGLDPAHHYSLSAFSYNAMLKFTRVELELLSDVEMLSFIKNSIRGGFASSNKRRATANNKYLPTYNEDEEESFIMYYDANNLYGYAMSQPLPYTGFEWVDVNVNYKVPEDSEVGYILEVDLFYPKELHDCHSDLPFCPEKKTVLDNDTNLLLADLTKKHNYVIHYTYLLLCEEHGLKVEKVHRVLKFKQKPWLKPYIDFNNSKRVNAKTDFEKNMFKLLNNSIYGKTIQNIENYDKIKLCNDWWPQKSKAAAHYIARSDYVRHTICSKKMVAIKQKTTHLKFKDPIYVGFCVLDISKAYMYKFHYDFMKNKFGDNLRLLYTDTDAFIYQIKTHDYYSAIKPYLEEWFDTSNYESPNRFDIPQLNKKELGYFKDEVAGKIVKEFIALRPRMYVVDADGKTITKASGVPRSASDKFTVEDYRYCLDKNEPKIIEFMRIKAVSHDLYTQQVRKVGLSPKNDNKRYMLPNRIDTLPWGHYSIMDIGNE